MAIDTLRAEVSSLLTRCSRHASLAARKLQLRGARKLEQLTSSSMPSLSRRVSHAIPFLGGDRRRSRKKNPPTSEDLEGERTWRRGMASCCRGVSRAARELQLRGACKLELLTSSLKSLFSRRVSHVIPFLGGDRHSKKPSISEEAEEEIWRRGIIMGEKCQPLDFSGAIYYDLDGRQLAATPVHRSPVPAYTGEVSGCRCAKKIIFIAA